MLYFFLTWQILRVSSVSVCVESSMGGKPSKAERAAAEEEHKKQIMIDQARRDEEDAARRAELERRKYVCHL